MTNYLDCGEIGVFVGQHNKKVCLHIYHSQDDILPPVLLEHGEKVAPDSHRHSVDDPQEDVGEEGLGGGNGNGVTRDQQL